MALKHQLEFLAQSVRRYGVGGTWRDLRFRLINRFVDYRHIVVMIANDGRTCHVSRCAGYDARFLENSEVWRLSEEVAHQLPVDFVSAALDRGDRCHAVFDAAGALAAYAWFATGPSALDEHYDVHFHPGWVYMYKAFVLPQHRGRRINGWGVAEAVRQYCAKGYEGVISCVLAHNGASLKSMRRMGFRTIGDVYLLRAAGYNKARSSRGCASHGFAITPHSASAQRTPTSEADRSKIDY